MNNTNEVAELARVEATSFGQETRNRADGVIREILQCFNAKSLADVTEEQLENFRYMANLHADSDVYRLLLIRWRLVLSGIA